MQMCRDRKRTNQLISITNKLRKMIYILNEIITWDTRL